MADASVEPEEAVAGAAAAAAYRFGPFCLDTDARRLTRDGAAVVLQPRIYALLEYLARNAGKAVSRDELMDAIWPGVIVSDQSLAEAISRLRKSLGDDTASPEYIETIRGYGFRFAATVMSAGSETADEMVPAREVWPPLWKLALPGLLLSGLFVTIMLGATFLGAIVTPPERVVLAALALPDGTAVRDWTAELSPEEDRLAFVRSDPPRLLVMDLETETTEVVAPLERIWESRQLRWSPTGREIAYSDRPQDLGAGVVDLFDLDSGRRSRVLERDDVTLAVLGWSPDGRKLLVFARSSASPELLLVDRGGERIYSWAAGLMSEARVSPDGQWLAVAAYTDESEELVIAALAGVWNDPAGVSPDRFRDWGSAARITQPPIDDDAPRWNAGSDSLLFFAWQGGNRNLWEVGLRDGVPTGQPRTVSAPGGPYHLVGWTAAREIFFSSYHTGSDVLVWSLERGSDQPQTGPFVVSLESGRARNPMWSGDPHQLLYTSFHEDRTAGDLYRATLDPQTGEPGIERTRLSVDGRLLYPVWSADGNRLYYPRRLETMGWGLFRQDLGSQQRVRMLPEAVFAGAPRTSRDAGDRYLLVAAPPPGEEQVGVVPAGRYLVDLSEARTDASLGRRLDDSGVPATLAPDATWFATATADGRAIEAVDVETGSRRTLAVAPGGGWTISGTPAIAPDGATIAYITERWLPESLCPDSQLWLHRRGNSESTHVAMLDAWSPTHVTWSSGVDRLAIKTWRCEDGVMRFAPPQ